MILPLEYSKLERLICSMHANEWLLISMHPLDHHFTNNYFDINWKVHIKNSSKQNIWSGFIFM